MKNALSLALLVTASAAHAQGIPMEPLPPDIIRLVAAMDDEVKRLSQGGIPVVDVGALEAAARSKAQADLLVGIQQQLIDLNQVMQRSVAANAAAVRVCKYKDKSYSEGAVHTVGASRLICVERSETRELVWEPIASRRLSAHLRASGQDPASK